MSSDFIPLMKPHTSEHILNLLDFAVQHAGTTETEKAIQIWLINNKDNLKSIVKHNHPTEQNFPEMTKRFIEIQDEMYKTFLDKNNDYSRWNILGTGIVGICTRFWDKTARIMNLCGFNIGTGEYIQPKKNMVEDENIEKTFLDASVYGIIARIYLEGKWGK